MAPRSRLWPDPRVKPPFGAAEIDWGHPLAQGLLSLWLFNEGGAVPRDAVTGGSSVKSANPEWKALSDGLGIHFAATADYYDIGTATQVCSTTKHTTAVIRRKTDTTFRGSALFGLNLAAPGTKAYGAHVPWSDGTVYWDFGGKAGANRLTWVWTSTTAIERFVFVAGTLGSSIWLNGVRKANQTTAITRASATEVVSINRGTEAPIPGGDLQEVFQCITLNHEWTADKVLWWTAEPYAMLRPIVRRRYFVPAGTAAALESLTPTLVLTATAGLTNAPRFEALTSTLVLAATAGLTNAPRFESLTSILALSVVADLTAEIQLESTASTLVLTASAALTNVIRLEALASTLVLTSVAALTVAAGLESKTSVLVLQCTADLTGGAAALSGSNYKPTIRPRRR